MQSWLPVVIVKSILKRSGWGHFLLIVGVRVAESHRSGSCHLTNDRSPSSYQETEVCVCCRLWSVWLGGWSVVGVEWSGSSHHGALRQQ